MYQSGTNDPFYVFSRGFDSVQKESNNLILSNNGEIIFYIVSWDTNDDKEGLKSINVYHKGKLIKGYTESEITVCDPARERCSLLYNNYDEVVDEGKSNAAGKRIFKVGTTEKDRFLFEYPLFSYQDTVYLTDSKRKVHRFDLKDGNYNGSIPFDEIYEELRAKARFTKVLTEVHQTPFFPNFPQLVNGKNTEQTLAEYLGMKTASISGASGVRDEQFKIYRFNIDTMISRDGTAEIEAIEVDEDLPKDKIIQFFKENKFDISSVPQVFPKWYFKDYFFFRKKDDKLARKEKQEQTLRYREALKKNLAAEEIDGRYIPKDLRDAFLQLDKELPEIDRKEMTALKGRKEMIAYHLGLGTWMRNNWGLWGGSRLQKYFTDKGVNHPEDMSSIILFFYWDWLQGNKESWKDWESNPKQNLF